MDPHVAWNNLIAAYVRHDWYHVQEIALTLLQWLLRGGFPPDTGADRPTAEHDAAVAQDFCMYAYAAALRARGYAPPFDIDRQEGTTNDA
jgi:hypothetical protein